MPSLSILATILAVMIGIMALLGILCAFLEYPLASTSIALFIITMVIVFFINPLFVLLGLVIGAAGFLWHYSQN